MRRIERKHFYRNQFAVGKIPQRAGGNMGYGFTSCGEVAGGGNLGTTERFDDVANTHTARTAATARQYLAGYSLNGYGFTSCGYDGEANVGTTERFDDVANTHTARADATARSGLAGYSLNEYFINYITFNE